MTQRFATMGRPPVGLKILKIKFVSLFFSPDTSRARRTVAMLNLKQVCLMELYFIAEHETFLRVHCLSPIA